MPGDLIGRSYINSWSRQFVAVFHILDEAFSILKRVRAARGDIAPGKIAAENDFCRLLDPCNLAHLLEYML